MKLSVENVIKNSKSKINVSIVNYNLETIAKFGALR